MSELSSKALQVAISQIGEEEKPHGSNWGVPVKNYLASVGIHFPASWCMAFIYWCFDLAADDLKIPNSAIKTGGVLKAYHDATHKANDPEIGAVFIMDFGHGLGHTGIVERFDDTFIYTIEGNTNDTGGREGIEVCRKRRARKTIIGYLIY